jgi:predicted transcriptional regulator
MVWKSMNREYDSNQRVVMIKVTLVRHDKSRTLAAEHATMNEVFLS